MVAGSRSGQVDVLVWYEFCCLDETGEHDGWLYMRLALHVRVQIWTDRMHM